MNSKLLVEKYEPEWVDKPEIVTWGIALKHLMDTRKYSITSLARASGSSYQAIAMYINDMSRPSVDKARRICQAMGLELEDWSDLVDM